MEIDGPNEETVLENIGLSTDIFCCNLHLKQRKQSEILGMYFPEKNGEGPYVSKNLQSTSRHDASLRAGLTLMIHWAGRRG